MSACVLRPSVLFGKGDLQLVPPIHACLGKQETPWVVGDGTNLWDVTYVDNVADAHILAAENLMSSKTAAGEIFFIQNNEPISFRDLSLEIWKNFGHVRSGFLASPGTALWSLHQRYSFLSIRYRPCAVIVIGWTTRDGRELTSPNYRCRHLRSTSLKASPGSWAC
jgi:nucleoside-diphosphate-sugar epimerase